MAREPYPAITLREDVQRERAARVGLLMKSYRDSFLRDDGRRGLSQEEVLRRMGAVDGEYGERFSHTTVSRWESGATRPTIRRLEIFAKALDLSTIDLEILITVSGLTTDSTSTGNMVDSRDGEGIHAGQEAGEESDGTPGDMAAGNVASDVASDVASMVRAPARVIVAQYLPFAAFIVVSGYVLSLLGWNATWTPIVYVSMVTLLVVAGGLLFPGKTDYMKNLFTVSVFVILTTPLLQFMPLRMDHYNFYAIDGFFDTPLPYIAALLVNLTLAYGAGVLFHVLRDWQDRRYGDTRGELQKAIWTVSPPVGIVYAIIVMISNVSVWIQCAVLMPSLAAVFIILLLLRDSPVRLKAHDRQFLLWSTFVVATVASLVGLITVMGVFVSPDLPRVLPDHNLFRSWEIDFTAMGYSREVALERLNLGYMWHAMCIFAYMFFVIGGHVFTALYRIEEIENSPPTPNGDAV